MLLLKLAVRMFNFGKIFHCGQNQSITASKQVVQVMQRFRRTMPGSWLPQVVCLTTPFAAKISLSRSGLPRDMNEFITAYEPRAAAQGIFVHQQQVLTASLQHRKHILLTSATGSGKSLCFWAWIAHKLAQDPRATALVCFPTQALLWGQSVRLQEISQHCRTSRQGLAYSGQFTLAGQIVDWTVWKGSGKIDQEMALHEQSPAFKQARLRIATIDKIHYSLLRKAPQFVAKLQCLVLDEAHQYQGVFGAQVAYLLKRLATFQLALGQPPFQAFLASATLPQAKMFAAKLLSVTPDEIVYQTDAIQTVIEPVSWLEAEDWLAHPPQSALLRTALFYDKQPTRPALASLLGSSCLGQCNSVYFSPSKQISRLLQQKIYKNSHRQTVIYDADLPLAERRVLEQEFRQTPQRPITLIATTALELGVDISGLDICFIPEVPLNLSDFLQRIGRVGRRQGQPGLIVVNLSTSQRDEQYRRDLTGLFHLPRQQQIFLPVQLDWIKLKSLAALNQEFRQAQSRFSRLPAPQCQQAIRLTYGEWLSDSEIKRRLEKICGTPFFDRNYWQYAGFRGGQDKVALIDQSTSRLIAVLDRNAVLRQAHIGACYIDHHSSHWQVVSYGRAPGTVMQLHKTYGINVAQIQLIYAKRTPTASLTSGICHCEMKLTMQIAPCCQIPEGLHYGRWQVRQTTAAYRKVGTAGQPVIVKSIPLNERLIYDVVTLGWCWRFPTMQANQLELCLREMTDFFVVVFAQQIVQVAGISSQDVIINFSARRGELCLLDALPGGSGLALWLLRGGMKLALKAALQVLVDFKGNAHSLPDRSSQAITSITNLDDARAILTILCRKWR